jgi:hypothetical protein
MSMGRCFEDLLAAGAIPAARVESMRQVYDELLQQYEPKFGRAAAESMASEKAMVAIDHDFARRKANALLQAKAQATIADNATRLYRGNTSGKPSADGLVAHLVDDQRAPFGNVEYRWKNLRNTAHRMMYSILWKHRSNLIGEARKLSDFDDVVDALDGIDRGANAREMADSFGRTAEWLRGMFNAAGGDIGKLEGWALPHNWDGVKVGLAGFDKWRGDILAQLDRAKMIDRNTGEPMADFRLEDVLRQVYETQVSEGAAGQEASSIAGGKAFANRRGEARVLHFKPGGWKAVNDLYGSGHALDAMLHHVDSMSRDIAAMQILGPNPTATIRWMQDLIGKTALTDKRLIARFGTVKGQRQIERIWDEITGMNRVAARPNVALFFSTLRNWQSATKLGSAAVSSVPDVATQALTTRFNGLPATKAIGNMLAEFNPLDGSHREWAARAFLIQDEMIGRSAGFGRQHFEGEMGGSLTAPTIEALRDGRIGKADYAALQLREKLQAANEFSRRASNFTMRAGLLNQWTMRMRGGTYMEFWNAITSYAPQEWGQLNGRFRGFLERYGIRADGWDALRSTPRVEHGGSQWITPDAIADVDLRNRIQEGIMTELDYAVATGGIRQRAAMTVGRPGELTHELVRSGGQFLLFPITVTWRHASRAWAMEGVRNKALYGGAFLIATTLMGALAEQLTQLRDGKDPRPMGNLAFVRKAISRGGALGYYGEILDHVTAENGNTLDSVGNVPVVGSLSNISDLLVRQPYLAATGAANKDGTPKANFLRAATRVARYELPGSNLWYTKLAYQRLLLDQLDAMADRHPGEAQRRLERRARDEGTKYWAPPGSGPADWRAPDFANAMRDSSEAQQQ